MEIAEAPTGEPLELYLECLSCNGTGEKQPDREPNSKSVPSCSKSGNEDPDREADTKTSERPPQDQHGRNTARPSGNPLGCSDDLLDLACQEFERRAKVEAQLRDECLERDGKEYHAGRELSLHEAIAYLHSLRERGTDG